MALMWLWFAGEVVLGLRRRAGDSGDRKADRGSERLIWLVVFSCFLLAGASQLLALPRLPGAMTARLLLGSTLMVLGLAIRWHSIHTLGRFFTTNVAVREDHRIVQSGLYRWLRHPSYTGLLVAGTGCGIGLGNWLSLALCTLPMLAVLAHRIRVEEQALVAAFGDEYREYSKRTWRLIPWVL